MHKKLTPEELGKYTRDRAAYWWNKLHIIYPGILVTVPRIEFSNRLKTTAGLAYAESIPQFVRLSTELLWEHTDEMLESTLPHELCHLVAWSVYQARGHGPDWRRVMIRIGLEPDVYHNMTNSKHEARRAK